MKTRSYNYSSILLMIAALTCLPAQSRAQDADAPPEPVKIQSDEKPLPPEEESYYVWQRKIVPGFVYSNYESQGTRATLAGVTAGASYEGVTRDPEMMATGRIRLSLGRVGDRVVLDGGMEAFINKTKSPFGLAFGAMRTQLTPSWLRITALEGGVGVRTGTRREFNGHVATTIGFTYDESRLGLPSGADPKKTDLGTGTVLSVAAEQNIMDVLKIRARLEKGSVEGGKFQTGMASALVHVGPVEFGPEAVFNQQVKSYVMLDGSEQKQTSTSSQVTFTVGGVF